MSGEARTRWALRLLAAGLALAAWFFVSWTGRERVTETTVEPFIQYNPPPGHTVLNPVLKARLRLRGPSSRISGLNPLQVNVVVDLRNEVAGTVEVPLGTANVVAPQDLDLVSIEPNVLPLQIDRVLTEMRPVEARLVGEPAAGAIAQSPEVVPPSVLVTGPESILRQIPALYTAPISLDGHALDFEERVLVASPNPQVSVNQPVVSVRVPMQIPNTTDPGGADGER